MEKNWDMYLKKWQAFISQVQTGYKFSIYDYANDLSARDILEELLGAAPPEQQTNMQEMLRPLDEQFREITRANEQPLTTKPEGQSTGWWWLRVPKKLEDELQADIASL